MKQSPSWEANGLWATQEILRILWNQRVLYRIHYGPAHVSILSQINPVHASHPTSWRSILILSSHLLLGVPTGLFTSGFSTKTLYAPFPFPHTCYMTRAVLSSWFDHPNNAWWDHQATNYVALSMTAQKKKKVGYFSKYRQRGQLYYRTI